MDNPRSLPAPAGMNERTWVRTLLPSLQVCVQGLALPGGQTRVSAAKKLPYVSEVFGYGPDNEPAVTHSEYETDLLIEDVGPAGEWVPRVIIEAKLGGVTTHDALTYSAKAATHKHVHPYLRYGLLAGAREHYAVPVRLVRHGAFFDFMVAWAALRASAEEWTRFSELIRDEVIASRTLQALLQNNRSRSRKRYSILHRPLRLWLDESLAKAPPATAGADVP